MRNNPTLMRRFLYAACVLTTMVVVLLVVELKKNRNIATSERLATDTAIMTATIRNQIDSLTGGVRDISALLKSTNRLSPTDLSEFMTVTKYLENRGQPRAVAVMPVIPPNMYQAFGVYLNASESERRALGYPDWTWVPSVPPKTIAPAIMVESAAGRDGIFGYDIFTSEERRGAVKRAQILGAPQFSQPVRLSQDGDSDDWSVLIVDSVTLDQPIGSESDIDIVVGAGFTPKITLNGLLSERQDFDVELWDVTDETPLPLFRTSPAQMTTELTRFETIEAGGRRWEIRYIPTPEFEKRLFSPWIVGMGATIILILVLLTLVLDRLIVTRIDLERKVQRRTAALEAANLMLTEAIEKSTRESRAKSDFLARMSHDLRTPLNAIIGYANLIQSEVFGSLKNTQYREYIDNIEQAGQMQLRLVDDVLTYSALHEEAVEARISDFDPTAVVSSLVEVMKLQTDAHDLEVMLSIDPSIGIVQGDHGAFEQIVTNILSNAIKYTPDGGVIRVSLQNLEADYVLEVRDTGIGIQKDQLQKVLEPFTRIDDDPYITSEGYGLGLSIVKKLVALNQGSFTIESEPRFGTRAVVTLPKHLEAAAQVMD